MVIFTILIDIEVFQLDGDQKYLIHSKCMGSPHICLQLVPSSFLIVYATDHIAHKIAKVAVIIVLVLYLDIDNIYVRSDNANIHETRVDV